MIALLPHHQHMIDASAIDRDVAAERGYRSVERKVDLKCLGFTNYQSRVPALLVPIHSVHGGVATYQLRPDTPRVSSKTGKAVKYETLAARRVFLDVPCKARVNIGDPKLPLFITEGVRKADSAVSKGLCCIALLGIWNWRGTNEQGGKVALADWESVALNGRRIFIAFDSDADQKHQIRKALLRLKRFLESRGTDVQVLHIPSGPGGTKVGLDDFFAAGHTVDELLATAAEIDTDRNSQEGQPEHGRYGRPLVVLEDADLHALTLETWAAIERSNAQAIEGPTLFRHGGAVARIERGDDGQERIGILRQDTMRRELVRMVEFLRPNLREAGETVAARPPADLVTNLLAWPYPPLPLLIRLVQVPIFDRKGRLVTSKGYDRDSRLFLPANSLVVPPIPKEPSSEEVKRARDLILKELLGDFPFLRPADRANAVAILLLPFVRELIDGPTPLHLIEKPTPGTGAGLLTEVLAIPALGCPPALMAEGRDEDEWRKRITAVLSRGPTFVILDNIRSTLDSAALSAVLTATSWEDRLLGHSRVVTLPVRCVWVATGNNPAVSHEIARRSVPIRLDSGKENPWERPPENFRYPELRVWTMGHRSELVWAALVLTQAWLAANRPSAAKKKALGSYESYSNVLGGILTHAGIEGFLENLSDFYNRADREGESWRRLVAAWWLEHEDEDVGTADIWALLQEDDCNLPLGKGTEKAQRTTLGILLRQVCDRRFRVVHSGAPLQVRLERVGEKQGAARYRLAPETAREPGEPGERCPPPAGPSSDVAGEPGEPPGRGFDGLASAGCRQPSQSEPSGNGSRGSRGSHPDLEARPREVLEL